MHFETVSINELSIGDVVWVADTLRIVIDRPIVKCSKRWGRIEHSILTTFGYVLNPESLDAISDPFGSGRAKLADNGGRWKIAGRVESNRAKFVREVK